MLNLLIDGLIGAIPLIGTIFDFYYKANTRNINLLKAHYEEGKYRGSGTGVLVTIVIVLILFLALFLYISYKVLAYLVHLF